MNQKLVKAKKRLLEGRGRAGDNERVERHYKALDAQPITKFKKERKHKVKAAIPPTWPRTGNQRLQSRPLIVVKPIRAARIKLEREAAEQAEIAARAQKVRPVFSSGV